MSITLLIACQISSNYYANFGTWSNYECEFFYIIKLQHLEDDNNIYHIM